MKVLVLLLVQVVLPASSRVTLYDILSAGSDDSTPDASARQNHEQQQKHSSHSVHHTQRFSGDDTIYGNSSPFNIRKYPPFQSDQHAYRIFETILTTHQVSNDVCVQSALKMCDIKPMAQLLEPNQDACTLVKEFDMCLHRELAQCSGEDVTLVKTSLRYLLEGFQVNGHCKHVTLTERRDDTEEHVTGAQSCNPHETWQCSRNLISNLKGKSKTCDALRNFRHCIHRRTRSCTHEQAKYLRDASKGLSILHRHSHLC